MPISQVFNNAISGLNAAKRGTEVTSSNIANALTPGYGVRRLELTARDYDGMSSGVSITGMQRDSDPFLLGERRVADARVGYQDNIATALQSLEGWLGKVGDESGLAASVSRLEASLVAAASDPSANIRLEGAVSALQDISTTLNTTAEKISNLRVRAEDDIVQQTDKLNENLKEIDFLNEEILRLGNAGQPIAGLYDQRQQLVDSISEIVPVRIIQRQNGRIALVTTGGETLVDHEPVKIGFTRVTTITPDMTRSGGALSGITLDGRPAAGGGHVGLLKGGSLEAAFEVRDNIAPEAQERLDNFTKDLMTRLSDSSVDTTITGGRGLLVDPRPAASATTLGLSNLIKVNPDLEGNGDAIKLRDGLNAAAPGPSGNASLLQGWATALQEHRSPGPGLAARSVTGNAADLSSFISNKRINSEVKLAGASNSRSILKQKELSQGVDTDQEMQMLMQLEQAYSANAKVIQAASRMLTEILEI